MVLDWIGGSTVVIDDGRLCAPSFGRYDVDEDGALEQDMLYPGEEFDRDDEEEDEVDSMIGWPGGDRDDDEDEEDFLDDVDAALDDEEEDEERW